MRAVTAPLSALRHTLGALTEAILIVAIIATLLALVAPVLKPAGQFASPVDARGKASSVSLSVPDGVFGGTTTGVITGTGATWVDVVCTISDGSVGLNAWAKPDSAGSFTVGLGPTPSWSSGGATCKATAGAYSSNGRWRALGATTFSVSA